MTSSELLFQKLKSNQLDFFVSVPCKLLADLIAIIEQDKSIVYTPVTREEEGIGITAGAYLAGKHPAILLQNSGLGNSINAICSLLNYYRLPLVFIISHRGLEGEQIDAQRPMGEVTEKLLRDVNIPFYEIRTSLEIGLIDKYVKDCFKNSHPVAFLFPHSFWN